ncbi:7003_t:CDS:2, partial [Acaulospora colombiana]
DATSAIDLLVPHFSDGNVLRWPPCKHQSRQESYAVLTSLKAFRAAFDPRVKAAVCFFATDIHTATLGKGDDSLEKVKNGALTGTDKAELVVRVMDHVSSMLKILQMIFGKQDTHVPRAGRDLIRKTLEDADVTCSFLEVQAQHAFIRDESSKGRWDAALTRNLFGFMMEVFQRRISIDLGDAGAPSKIEHVCREQLHLVSNPNCNLSQNTSKPSKSSSSLSSSFILLSMSETVTANVPDSGSTLTTSTKIGAGSSQAGGDQPQSRSGSPRSVPGVAKAYTSILQQLVASSPTSPTSPSAPSNHTIIRLLISHNLMGTIIGRNGLKIKHIQDSSGARMVAQKDMLPQSTERIVEVQGSPEAIGKAIEEIGKCLLEDWERGLGTVLYQPGAGGPDALTTILAGGSSRRSSYANPGLAAAVADAGRRVSLVDFSPANGRSTNGTSALGSGVASSLPSSGPSAQGNSAPAPATTGQQMRTQSISIPSDMVGCIIGRAGTKITEIRRLSGSKISIAKGPHDETGERMFTIVGTPESNEKALYLLYNQLESEKERRVGRELAQQQQAEVGQ